LKELESWLERGQNVPFLREICPRKKCTPNIGADIGAITGILLKGRFITHISNETINTINTKLNGYLLICNRYDFIIDDGIAK
jgi:hypothetical protein